MYKDHGHYDRDHECDPHDGHVAVSSRKSIYNNMLCLFAVSRWKCGVPAVPVSSVGLNLTCFMRDRKGFS